MHTRLNEFHFVWKVLFKHSFRAIQSIFITIGILQLCTTGGLLISSTQHELLKLIKHKNLYNITKLKRNVTSELVLSNIGDKTPSKTLNLKNNCKNWKNNRAVSLTPFSQYNGRLYFTGNFYLVFY